MHMHTVTRASRTHHCAHSSQANQGAVSSEEVARKNAAEKEEKEAVRKEAAKAMAKEVLLLKGVLLLTRALTQAWRRPLGGSSRAPLCSSLVPLACRLFSQHAVGNRPPQLYPCFRTAFLPMIHSIGITLSISLALRLTLRCPNLLNRSG